MPKAPAQIVLLPASADAVAMVAAALQRSFSAAQLTMQGVGQVVVAVDPDDDSLPVLRRITENGGKAVLFGRPGPAVAAWAGLSVSALGPEESAWDRLHLDPAAAWDASSVRLLYPPDPLWRGAPPYAERPLWRFDFTDEWNNLGYGRIRTDGGPFALACLAEATADARVIAAIAESPWCYASLRDAADHSVLWVGRAVGPLDSQEWRLVERFIADWRAEDLACLPCLEDVPFGYDATVTMRLDCDQDISSARPLFDLYRER
ncbi:MAG TPA: hypothetical protein VK558_04650, partial [Patescibacteria group bacterium]|nr:hypothetical protein [Patescibacteria group bacterium]